MKQTTTQANAKFAQMCDQFVKDSLALSPVNASRAGYHKHKDPKTGKTIDLDAQLDDVSSQGMAAQEKFYRDWRKRFQTETPVASLNAQDAADYRLIDDQIALSLLDFEHIQSYKHNPTGYVELIGNGMFLPLTQEYASKEVRVGRCHFPHRPDSALYRAGKVGAGRLRSHLHLDRGGRERGQHQSGRYGRRRHPCRIAAEGAV